MIADAKPGDLWASDKTAVLIVRVCPEVEQMDCPDGPLQPHVHVTNVMGDRPRTMTAKGFGRFNLAERLETTRG